MRRKYAALGHGKPAILEVSAREVPLAVAVSTYLFNSQILDSPGGGFLLLAARECRLHPRTRKYLEALPDGDWGSTRSSTPISAKACATEADPPACACARR